MSRGDGFGPRGEAGVVTLDAGALAGGKLVVPLADFLLTADFTRSGTTLEIRGTDGTLVRIEDYFRHDEVADLWAPGGAVIPGELVERLAGPAAEGWAQAAGTGGRPIGVVEQVIGSVQAERADGSTVNLSEGSAVFQGDIVSTGAGARLGIRFADETAFAMEGNGRMVLDELVYDPSSGAGSASVSILQGAFVFVTGQIAKTDPDNFEVKTPLATIGVRGTLFGGIQGEQLDVFFDDGRGFVFNLAGRENIEAGQNLTVLSAEQAPGAAQATPAGQFDQIFALSLGVIPTTPFTPLERRGDGGREQDGQPGGQPGEQQGQSTDGQQGRASTGDGGGTGQAASDEARAEDDRTEVESTDVETTDVERTEVEREELEAEELASATVTGFGSEPDGTEFVEEQADAGIVETLLLEGETPTLFETAETPPTGLVGDAGLDPAFNDPLGIVTDPILQATAPDQNSGQPTAPAINFQTGSGDLSALATAGQDNITGAGGADTLAGGGGNDTLIGVGGNDVFNGGADNDVINGGAGIDTAVFGGNLAAYSFAPGSVIVTGPDGVDHLTDVEFLQFDDQTIAAPTFGASTFSVNDTMTTEGVLDGGGGPIIAGTEFTTTAFPTMVTVAEGAPITFGGITATDGLTGSATDIGAINLNTSDLLEVTFGTPIVNQAGVPDLYIAQGLFDFNDAAISVDGGNSFTTITGAQFTDTGLDETLRNTAAGFDLFESRVDLSVLGVAEGASINSLQITSGTVDGLDAIILASLNGSGTSGLRFTVTRAGDTTSPGTVQFTTSTGSADAADFTAVSGTLSFAVGETSKLVVVPVTDDTMGEGNEVLNFTLIAATGGTIADGNGFGTIIDNDGGLTPTVSIANAAPSSEGAPLSFDVSLDIAAASDVTVDFSVVGDTALFVDGDFATRFGSVTIPGGSTSVSLSIPTTDDAVFESAEGLFVDLNTVTGPADLGTGGGARITEFYRGAGSLSDIDFGIGGDFGTDVYGVDIGTFGANDDQIVRLTDTNNDGIVDREVLSSGNPGSAAGIAFDHSGSNGFGTNMFVLDYPSNSSQRFVHEVGNADNTITVTQFSTTSIFNPNAVTFATDGSGLLINAAQTFTGFGGTNDGRIFRVDDMGAVTVWADGANSPTGNGLWDPNYRGAMSPDGWFTFINHGITNANQKELLSFKDLNADGDALDAGEARFLADATIFSQVGAATFDNDGNLILGSGSALWRLSDLNGDNDFWDAGAGNFDDGEAVVIASGFEGNNMSLVTRPDGSFLGLWTTGTEAIVYEIETGVTPRATGTIIDNDGTPTITGTAGNDTLNGTGAAEIIEGLAGNDSLFGGPGNDTLLGGLGSDISNSATGDDVFDGGFADGALDTAFFPLESAGYTVTTVNEITTVTDIDPGNGDVGTDTLTNVSNVQFGDAVIAIDVASGTAGDDVVVAPATADTIFGLAGNDSLNGGGGNDTLIGGPGNDTLNGSSGTDEISYANDPGGVTVDLVANTATDGTGGTDTLVAIEGRVVGSAFNDVIQGSIGVDFLRGGDGNDTITGNAGNDSLVGGGNDDVIDGGAGTNDNAIFSGAQAGYTVTTVGATTTVMDTNALDGDDGTDTLTNIEFLGFLDGTIPTPPGVNTINGTIGNDVLNGTAGPDEINGLGGADQLNGLAGNDTLMGGDGSDTLAGGFGDDVIDGGTDGVFDVASYAGIQADFLFMTVDGVTTVTDTNTGDGDEGTDTVTNVHTLQFSDGFNTLNFITGTAGNDTLTGTGNAEEIRGFAGNDSLFGSSSDDTLLGGAGNDTIDGGAGTADLLSYADDTAGASVSLLAGTATDGSGGADVFSGIERLLGSDFGDTLIGSNGLDSIDGGDGGDFLSGLNNGDTLFGGLGNDTLKGGAGNDLLSGGLGTDIADYSADGAAVTVNFLSGTAVDGNGDTDILNSIEGVEGSASDDTFISGVGNQSFDGGNGVDALSYQGDAAGVTVNLATGIATDGSGGTDTLSNVEEIDGSLFADMLIGSNTGFGLFDGEGFRGNAGNDIIQGAGGLDRAEYDNATAGITVNVAAGSVVGDTSVGTDSLDSIEIIDGTNFIDTYTGGAVLNGSMVINGVDDLFQGRGGNDIINGDGNTTVIYDEATAGVVVDLAAGTAVGDASVGSDTLTNVANVIGSDFADNLTGSGGNNIFQPLGGMDTIDGAAGVDRLFFLTDDTTSGVVIDLAAGTITNDGFGNTGSITSIESVTGTFNDDSIAGGAGANLLEGESGNDTISGGASSDTLFGGNGIDLMDGGAGNDDFIYEETGDGTQITTNQTIAASGLATDVINNFVSAEDDFSIDETGFVTSPQFVSIGTAYDGTNSGLGGGAAFIFDGTHLSFDFDVTSAGYTALAQVNGDAVVASDITTMTP